jgi:hypothetical protein
MDNPCLRPASLSDAQTLCDKFMSLSLMNKTHHEMFLCAVRDLYDAEWRLRGFERSP